ncbi:hypothetical protein [Brevibacillus laterosporus]|uniref:hypothetical protein n=1 Tax=Brevibacillus laterosporus TaxID=1465 RepID=UPI00215D4C6F|nr:hypothetical protein [Brevibacillus laterosporus]MCR8994582.1 hypothetical protein [Brevibacillus laterosporus]
MKISGVALGQWNQICKKKEGVRRTTYKIYRAISMGEMSHIYASGDYIVRYQDINLLISKTGLVLTVWRDTITPNYKISDRVKKHYDDTVTYKANIIKAEFKHLGIIRKIQQK